MSRALPCLALLALAAGCASSPPEWVDKLPQEKDALYAVSYSDRTSGMYESEIDVATENARAELGRTIDSKVRSVLVTALSGNVGSGPATNYVSEVSSNVSETALSGSQRVAVWVDRKGVTGARGRTYVMVKLSRSQIAEQFANKARSEAAKQNVKLSDDDIKKAFDELDEELAKRMK